MEHWVQEERGLYFLEGVHILLYERPLMVTGSFRMSVCRGRGEGDGRRNNDRKDSGNFREGQRIDMNNGTEWRFVSRVKHGDSLPYCRGNWCGWHWGGR